MQQVELVYKLDEKFLGTEESGLSGSSGLGERFRSSPKNLESLVNIPFPGTLRAMQSFLGSLNYYSRFIEDFAIYATVLYELRESDFHEIGRSPLSTKHSALLNTARSLGTGDVRSGDMEEDLHTKAKIAFSMLKTKIAATPILKHFGPDRPPVIIVYASK